MTAQKNAQTQTFSPAIVRAFADALENGFVGSLVEFADSEAGQVAASAIADQRKAELRSLHMNWARAVAKDLKVNSEITTYSAERAGKLRDFLNTVDLDSVPAPASATTDDSDGDSAAE